MTDRDFDKTALELFLRELRWDYLKTFMDSHSFLKKKFVAGGFQLHKKNRKLVQNVISKYGTKKNYIDLFLLWYEEQARYADILDSYFQSEEYKQWATETGVAKGCYALPDTKFDEFFKVLDPDHALWFLYLSPMVFDKEQEKQLLSQAENRQGIISPPADPHINTKESESNSLGTESLEKELKACRKMVKKLQNESESLKEEFEKLKQKNIRLSKRLSESHQKDDETKIKLDSELFECRELLAEQESSLKKKDQELTRIANVSREKDRQIKNLEKKLQRLHDESHKHFTRILGFLNSEKFLSSLNTSNDVREILETVVRPPTDDGNSEVFSRAEDFDAFWQELVSREQAITDRLLKVDIESVVSGEFFKDWADRTDDFTDLKCLLSTRLFMSQMLYDILYQYYLGISHT